MERIEQLRDSIKQKLENSEFEGRIKIDKDVLEKLLFNSYIVDVYETSDYENKARKPIKIPVWSGKFLQKIDLSEVDFADVYWANEDSWGGYIQGSDHTKIKWRNNTCNYSNTNANIDLGKAFTVTEYSDSDGESKKYNYIDIEDCNFENVDLSRSNLDGKRINCLSTDFKNTNIKINTEELYKIHCCNMENTDLSNITTDLLTVIDENVDRFDSPYIGSSFMNARLKIVCDEESLQKYIEVFDTAEEIEEFWDMNRKYLVEYNYVGCYFNGTLIESKEQLIELSTNAMKKLIDDYKKTTTEYKMNQLLKSIDEQIEGKRKKDINDMLNDKVEMIDYSIDEQIKSKQ